MACPRRIGAETAQRFGGRQPLIRLPATRRLAGTVLAGDRGIQAQAWIHLFHREVRAECEPGTGGQHPPPRIGAENALGADPVLCPAHVRGGVGGLHRGDHPELGKTRNVLQRDHLRMFDPPAVVAAAALAQYLGIGLQCDPVATIPDRMGGDLDMTGIGLAHRRFKISR